MVGVLDFGFGFGIYHAAVRAVWVLFVHWLAVVMPVDLSAVAVAAWTVADVM